MDGTLGEFILRQPTNRKEHQMEPNRNLLQRELSVEQARQDIGEVHNVVREMVDEGTQLLARLVMVAAQQSQPRRYHTSLLLLLRHVLEHLDAVDELLRQGITVPAMLHVRAIIESHAQMLYMSAERESFSPSPIDATVPAPTPLDPKTGLPVVGVALEQLQDFRGGAYIVADLRRQVRESERLTIGTVEPWLAKMSGKATGPAMLHDADNQKQLQAEIAALKTRLADPENALVNAEFDATKKNAIYDPAWYALQGGPKKVYPLAKSVGLFGEYELFYSPASEVMHGQDVRGQLGGKRPEGGHSVGALRSGLRLELVVTKLVIEIVRIYHHVIQAMRPGDKPQWDEWVKRWTLIVRQ